MFKIGELVFYGNTGVCRVTDIKAMGSRGADEDKLYYILNPLNQSCTISSPVGNTKVFIRPIMTKQEAEELIDSIPGINADAYNNQNLTQLREHYISSIGTHDSGDLVRLTMSIYSKNRDREQQKKKLGSVDKKYMKIAEDLLFGELAAALEIPRDSVQNYIANRLDGYEMN